MSNNTKIVIHQSFEITYSTLIFHGVLQKKVKHPAPFLGLANIHAAEGLLLIGTANDDEKPAIIEVEIMIGVPEPEMISNKSVTLIFQLIAGKNGLKLNTEEDSDIILNCPPGKVGVMIVLDADEVMRQDVRKIKIYFQPIGQVDAILIINGDINGQ
jgi:hypothetical protein